LQNYYGTSARQWALLVRYTVNQPKICHQCFLKHLEEEPVVFFCYVFLKSGGFLNPNPKYGGILQFSHYNYINEAKAVIATKARNNSLYKFC
jgi:hypothetical protein